MTQNEYLSSFLRKHRNAVIIGSLGKISKDLGELDNGKNKIIKVKGGMGCVMGIGLGYALNTRKKVYVLVGDGAFLMKLGSVALLNKYRPSNLEVIILNNNKYNSCGGQSTNFKYLKQNYEKTVLLTNDL